MFGIVLTRFPSKSKTSTWFAAGPETKTWWLASSITIEPKPVAPSATDEPDPATADDPTIAPAATSTTIAVANLTSLPRIGVTLPLDNGQRPSELTSTLRGFPYLGATRTARQFANERRRHEKRQPT